MGFARSVTERHTVRAQPETAAKESVLVIRFAATGDGSKLRIGTFRLRLMGRYSSAVVVAARRGRNRALT